MLSAVSAPAEKTPLFQQKYIEKTLLVQMNFSLQFQNTYDIINVAKSHASSGPLVPFAEAWAEIQGGAEV